MIRDIVFVVLLYLIIGTVLAIAGALRVSGDRRLQDLIESAASDSGLPYNIMLFGSVMVIVCAWPYALIRSML